MNGLFLVSLLALVAVAAWRMVKHGPRSAVGIAIAIAIALPIWISQKVFGQPIDLRIGDRPACC